uniref:Uncharacterized protein n=1 Tax=Lotharella globosa TaxID=91324 RepID=A0A7S3Z0E4_9EUKA
MCVRLFACAYTNVFSSWKPRSERTSSRSFRSKSSAFICPTSTTYVRSLSVSVTFIEGCQSLQGASMNFSIQFFGVIDLVTAFLSTSPIVCDQSFLFLVSSSGWIDGF